MAIRRKHIRDLVERLLQDRHITKPAVPVEGIVESLGIQVKSDSVEDGLSGFLVRESGSGKAVIGVNAEHHERRRRFTIAHELGHYLLHEGEVVHFDAERPGLIVNWRRNESSAEHSDLEKEANLFAAELLMPAKFLQEDLSDISGMDLLGDSNALSELADEYNVSVQALTFRLANLEYIKL